MTPLTVLRLCSTDLMLIERQLRVKIAEKERAQARSSRLQRRQTATDALVSLRRGDIINIIQGRHGGLAVVLERRRPPFRIVTIALTVEVPEQVVHEVAGGRARAGARVALGEAEQVTV